jgi:hypothetical protein
MLFKKQVSLRTLLMNRTKVTFAGFDLLLSGLVGNFKVEKIGLNSCQIEIFGPDKYQNALQAMQHNCSLT